MASSLVHSQHSVFEGQVPTLATTSRALEPRLVPSLTPHLLKDINPGSAEFFCLLCPARLC